MDVVGCVTNGEWGVGVFLGVWVGCVGEEWESGVLVGGWGSGLLVEGVLSPFLE